MRGEIKDEINAENIVSAKQEDEGISLEKQQEILLINKMAAGGKLPPKNQSLFLQKKLQQRKFFDSGDYAMNQNKEKKLIGQTGTAAAAQQPSQPSQQTPSVAVQQQQQMALPVQLESQRSTEELGVLPPHLRPPPLVSTFSTSTSIDVGGGDSDEEGGLLIPRPDTVPQRKASILHPSVHSKLSPQPHIHHPNDESITAPPQ